MNRTDSVIQCFWGKEKIFLFILFLGFLLRIFFLERMPSIHVDELLHGTISLDIEKYGILNYLLKIPFLAVLYTGPFHYLLLLMSLKIFGKSIFSLRIPSMVFGFLTIPLVYFLVKKYWDIKTAILISFILALLPVHVYFSRVGFELIFIPFLIILALYLLNEFKTLKNKKYFFLFVLVCGIGITFKLNFLFFLIGLILIRIILKYPSLEGITTKDWIISFLLFLIGIYPILIYNLQTESVFSWFKNFPITPGGNNLLNITENFARGLSNLWYLYGSYSILLFSSIGVILFNILIKPRKEVFYDKFILLIFIFMFIFASTLTLNKFTFNDFVILSPFLAIFIGRSLNIILFYLENKKQIVLLLLFISFIIFSYISDVDSFFYTWVNPQTPVLRIYTKCAEKGKELVEIISNIPNTHNIIIGEDDPVNQILGWYNYGGIFFNISYLEEIGIKKNSIVVISSPDCFPYHLRNNNYSDAFMNVIKENKLRSEILREIKNEHNDTIFTIIKI